MTLLFTHPAFLVPAGVLALAALALGLWAQVRPGQGVLVVGQRPGLQGLGMALVLSGLGLGLAEPRWGLPEVPRLTVHVVVDASRSMLAADCNGSTRWEAAGRFLDRLWSKPVEGIQYSLDLLTGDTIPLMPPGEDGTLLRDALKAVKPGEIGSPGTSLGRGIPQIVATVDKREPAILLLVSDGEETWEKPEEAQARALHFLGESKVPLYAVVVGGTTPQTLPVPPGAPVAGPEPLATAADPQLLQRLAEGSGGRLLDLREDPQILLRDLATGHLPMPMARSTLPAHPEPGAWLALAGLALWLLSTGKPMRAWRLALGGLLCLGTAAPSRAALPLPQGVKAWIAQGALERGDLEAARRWIPRGDQPGHRLLAAHIQLRSRDYPAALAVLAPLTGQGTPRPVPAWRAPALLLAARASMALDRTEEAKAFLERLLREEPGRPEAVHDLQSLIKDAPPPPPPNPKQPPPPPGLRPNQGAQQDELEGIQQKLPPKPPPGGVKDL
jgi:hypothetical protein